MKQLTRVVFAALLLGGTALPAVAELKIGVAAEAYPPFASQDAAGSWVGWEIDFINALCAEMKEECEITPMAWDGIIPALQEKKIDVIAASMAITAKRKQVISFSRFYYTTSIGMVALKDGPATIDAQALAGKSIAVQGATIHAAYVEKHFTESEIKTYKTLDEATADLAAGRVDAVQGETNALAAFVKTEAGVACCVSLGAVPPDPETLGEGVGAGLRQEDTALMDKIDAAIAALAASGKLKHITAAYPDLVTGIVLPE